jgi:hypothetical protein
MTVKGTLAYGKNFHFYHEALDNNHVYLELEDVSYDVGYRRIMVAIPIDVWEVIRGLGAAKFDLVNISDEELIRFVEERVDERIGRYQKAKSIAPEEAERLKFSDSIMFGAMNDPKEQQIASGIRHFRTERDRQREVGLRIAQHKVIEISTIHPDSNES